MAALKFPRFPAVVALTVLFPALAFAALDNPSTELAKEYGKQALARHTSPRAAAYLLRLHALSDEVDDLNLLAQTYASLLGRRSTHKDVRALTQRLYAEVERARGHLTKASTLLEPLGLLRSFYVVGSFDNEGKAGCDVDFGPEAGVSDLSTVYAAKSKELGWRPLTTTAPDGYVDLAAVLRPNTEAVAYALTFLEAAEETKVQLSVGTSGAFRLWVNGQKVASAERYNQPRPDQAKVAVRLRKGINRLLLKVCQETGPLGFYLRSERTEGATVSARPAFPSKVPPLEKGPPPQPVLLPTLTQALEREVKLKPTDATLRGEYATVLAHQRAFDAKARADVVEAEKAAALAPSDAGLLLLAAELQRDDHNLRRRHLESALAAAPKSPRVRLALAHHELAREHPERALPLLEAVVAEHPRFAPARLAQAQALESLTMWPAAVERYEAALRELSHVPEVVRAGARTARRLDRLEEAVARYRTALGLRFDDTNSRRGLAELLADLGRIDEAGEQLSTLLKLAPFENSARLRLAGLYAANNRPEAAAALFAEAKVLSPDEPEVHEREGRALLDAGKKDEALAAFRRALGLRPQNPPLKELLRSLEGDTAPVGTPYVLDWRPLLPAADALKKEDAVYLVDYTFTRVQPTGLSSRFSQVAVKVFTQRGVEAFRSFPLAYTPDRQELRILRARVTKADGSVVDSYAESERNMNEPWTGMYYDHRSRILSFPALGAGDVLELWFRLDDSAQDNLLSDYWGDVDHVQSTHPKLRYQYFVEMPASRPLFWNQSRLPPTVRVARERKEDRVLYRFEAGEVAKVVPEPAMPGWAEVATTLHVSTYRTWEQVGRYYWGLVRDQLEPNDELQRTVAKVLAGVDRKDERAVVRAIYNFVVTHTRYVALEFGIHGYKPYRVDRVLARRFGDCKDKASLIHAMLKVAGVSSRLVLLRMRHLGAIGEEPASLAAFNHAIAYVPSLGLFLDGTAEFHSARELPSADRVADILVVEPEGTSPFGTTPEAQAEDNLSLLTMKVALNPDGSAMLAGENVVKGQGAPAYRRAYQTPATRKNTFEQEWAHSFPGLKVEALAVNDTARLDEDVTLSFKVNVPRFAETANAGLRFHPLGSARAYTQAYAPLVERRYDLVMPQPWLNRFRVEYHLPAGFAAVDLPGDVVEDSPFGTLRLSVRQEGATLVCEGTLSFTVARVKAADYAAFRAWLGKVDQAMSRKLLVRPSRA